MTPLSCSFGGKLLHSLLFHGSSRRRAGTKGSRTVGRPRPQSFLPLFFAIILVTATTHHRRRTTEPPPTIVYFRIEREIFHVRRNVFSSSPRLCSVHPHRTSKVTAACFTLQRSRYTNPVLGIVAVRCADTRERMKIVALMRIRRGKRRVGGWRNRILVADTRRLKEGAAEMRFVGEDEDTMMILLLLLLLLHGIHNSSNRAQRGPVVGLSGLKIKLMAQHLLRSRRRSGSTAAVAATTTRTVDR